MKKSKIFITLLISIIIVALIINPKHYMEITLNALIVWATLLVPSLFPFFFFTRIFSSLNLTQPIAKLLNPATKKLYKCSGSSGYIFTMSILSGYPVGSKITADLYENGSISESEIKTITAFTSNSGPMFILGTVGIGMLLSRTAGIIIFISHILGALINGFIYKRQNGKEIKIKCLQNENKDTLTESMYNSIQSILMVGGYVVICFVLSNILIDLKIFNPIAIAIENIFKIDRNIIVNILSGLIEMTNGCLSISSTNLSLQIKTIMCCFLISFGGISTLLQAMSFLKKCGVSYKLFIIQKITHSIISTISCVLLSLFIPL